MVLTGSCGPTPILAVHGINKKFSSLGLKNRSGSENHACDHLFMTYIVFISHLYIWWCMLFLTYISICCFISLFIHTFLYVCNPLFLFHTKMPWWVLFKVFQKARLSKSIMPWTLFLQSFSRFYVRIRFYCIRQMIMSLVI